MLSGVKHHQPQLRQEGRAEGWGSWGNTLQLTAQEDTCIGGTAIDMLNGTTLPAGQQLEQGGATGTRRLYSRQDKPLLAEQHREKITSSGSLLPSTGALGSAGVMVILKVLSNLNDSVMVLSGLKDVSQAYELPLTP